MSGFDEWFSTEYAVATWDPYDKQNAHGRSDPRALYWHNGKNIVDGAAAGLTGCDSRIIMDKALPFIETAVGNEEPFFVVIWFHAPHAPVVGGPEYMAMYPYQTEDEQHYYATVTALDEQVGRLRKKLRDLAVSDNTMLWFCSDNGPEGTNGKRGRHQGSAGPFRGRKRSLYEGGVRVPGVLEWPARIAGGKSTDFPAVTSDYFPTVLDVLGYKIPAALERPYDGISLVPVMEGQLTERPKAIGFQTRGMVTLTDNRYKLVHKSDGAAARKSGKKASPDRWELYDLLLDKAESTDIAAIHADIVVRMGSELKQWQDSCAASSNGADY
jgi:arylsulfatase A-like enzyme